MLSQQTQGAKDNTVRATVVWTATHYSARYRGRQKRAFDTVSHRVKSRHAPVCRSPVGHQNPRLRIDSVGCGRARGGRLPPRLLCAAPPPRLGGRRPSPATGGLQTETIAAPAAQVGPALLDPAAPSLVSLVGSADFGEAGNRRRLASGRIPPLLAAPFRVSSAGTTENQWRPQRVDPAHESRESDVGRTPHSRRTAPTRL